MFGARFSKKVDFGLLLLSPFVWVRSRPLWRGGCRPIEHSLRRGHDVPGSGFPDTTFLTSSYRFSVGHRDVLSVLPRRLWSCTFLNVNLLWYPCTSWSALETLAHSQTSLCFSRPEILASHKIQRSTDLQPRHHFSTPCRPPGSICRPPGSKSSQTQKTSNGSADLHCCTTPTKQDVLIFKKKIPRAGWSLLSSNHFHFSFLYHYCLRKHLIMLK